MTLVSTSSTDTLSRFADPTLPLVCVQGIGFVGTAMAIAVASARHRNGTPRFNVIAVDLDTPPGRERAASLVSGKLNFKNVDQKLAQAHQAALATRNLTSSVDPSVYEEAAVVIVDVNLDVDFAIDPPTAHLGSLKRAITTLGERIPPGCLVIVETTVPPGTCAKVVAPILEECSARRGLPDAAFLLAHSYERVMPGAAYFDSIVNFWRVYSGHTEEAADACAQFLRQVINTEKYPLTRLGNTTASEMGKIMENSYRATTIAFVEEWSRLAEKSGVDLFPVIDAIRVRPTHNNFRQPGFGVGGYCLTKDPLFGGIAAREILGLPDLQFPISELAVEINQRMPLETLRLVQDGLRGSLVGRKILLLGVSYRADVGDTRHAPAETFVRQAMADGAMVQCFDPLLSEWPELGLRLPSELPSATGFDAIVFTSDHPVFTQLDLDAWLGLARPLLVDGNRSLTALQLQQIKQLNLPFRSIGRGTSS